MKPIRVFEAFAGIGAQVMALKNAQIPHEIVAISEIDKYAIKSYMAIHGTTENLGDITRIEFIPEADLWTYSFPCQDISMMGKGMGFKKNSQTRSGLLWEIERLLDNSKKPKYLLMENVPMIVSKKFIKDFNLWISTLTSYGYVSNWFKLNSMNFGIPQNRERVFMISSLDGTIISQPKPQHLDITLSDILENKVEDKYYLKKEQIEKAIFYNKKIDYSNSRCIQIGELKGKWKYDNAIYSIYGLSPTITTEGSLKFLIKNNAGDYTIRRLTPLECWRLMGFSDKAFYAAKNIGISERQLYKQAGNSIVIPVLEAIFKEMFLPENKKIKQKTLLTYKS